MYPLLERLWQEEDGQDLTEYALLLVLVSLTAMVAIHSVAIWTHRSFLRVVFVLVKHGADF